MSGFKHNQTGRSTGKQAGRKGRGNRPPPGEPFGWLTRDMLESPAWRALGINERKMIDRLLIEHLAHAGTENGNLICTYADFETYGVTRRYITEALRTLRYFGFVRVKSGEPNGAHRPPNIYRLTWIGAIEHKATNEWKGFTSEHVKLWKVSRPHARNRSAEKNSSPPPNCNKTQATIGGKSPELRLVKTRKTADV